MGSTAETRLYSWSHTVLEAAVFYVLLAAWVLPTTDDGPPAGLIAASTLVLSRIVERGMTASGAPSAVRLVASILVALAWAITAARICAPAGYWDDSAPRSWIVIGAVFGTREGAGVQPIVFWATALTWWRGAAIAAWEPGLEELFGKIRLMTVLLLLSAGLAGGRVGKQAELLAGCVVVVLAALVSAGLARRQDVAPFDPPVVAQTAGRRHGVLGASVLAIALAVLLLTLAVLGAGWLGPSATAPVVALAGMIKDGAGQAFAAATTWIASLLPRLETATSTAPTNDQPQPAADWSPVSLPHIPELLVYLGEGIVLAIGLAFTYIVFASVRKFRLRDIEIELPDIPEPTKPERPPTIAPRSLVVRAGDWLAWLRRRLLGRATRGKATGQRRRRNLDEPPSTRSVRALYRAFLQATARHGLSRHANETPSELAARAAVIWPGVEAPAGTLTAAYERARYGEWEQYDADVAIAATALQTIARCLPDGAQREPKARGRRG
ncbi:MAG: DUF4129 domain-containing protein [Chloroflexi bacterium]|nr:DUF4129 domain-containing protein [Chloroflexota bacterium]